MPPPTSANPAFALIARQSTLDGVKTTLSSWDNCMAKSYCKWPVIAAIIVGSLIVLSIVFCVVRCCCCGVECCCACCSCFNACCPSPRRKRNDYAQAPQAPQQPYAYPPSQPAPQPFMMYGANNNPAPAAPQFATFDSSRKGGSTVNADSLPAMPSWSNARERHVEDTDPHTEDIPLEEQKQPLVKGPNDHVYDDHGAVASPVSPHGATAAAAMAGGDLGTHPNPYSDHKESYESSPYDQDTSYGGAAAYGTAHDRRMDPYRQQQNPFNQPRSDPNSPASPVASSIYTTNPPPSYRTNPRNGSQRMPPNAYGGGMRGPPMPRQNTYSSQSGGNPFATPNPPPQAQFDSVGAYRSYSPSSSHRSPPPQQQPPTSYRAYAAEPVEMAGSEYAPSHSTVYEAPGQESWHERSQSNRGGPWEMQGSGRKPVQGSWREV